tara:strand:- start:164 stop:634 length:471 start_codon:yes stop_codon:yes gene_type:complete
MEKLPISPQGFESLQSELKRLKNEERPRIIKMIEFARSLGDLSENAEYETAKERQAFNDKRISELETKLSSCMVIDPSKVQDKSKLTFGLSFEIEDLDSGGKKIFQLLGPEESNPDNGSVSIESPLGMAALGRQEGDEFTVRTPAGPREYVLNKIF